MIESIDPRRARETQKARIEAAMDALAVLLKRKSVIDRDAARKIVEEIYRSKKIQPIRGKAWPQDIWDKELATLYVIAKYALMLHEENPDVFHRIFSYEETLEDVIRIINEKASEEARKFIHFLLGGEIDDNTIARILRLETTKLLLGFSTEDKVINLMKKLSEALPEHAATVRKYARYFIALRIAQSIAANIVRNRIAKEALKQALAAKIGFEKIMPNDEYIEEIAVNVFNIPKKKIARILALKNNNKKVRKNKQG